MTTTTFKNVLKKPRVTEKSANQSANNVYTFEVMPGATKHDIMRSILTLYKVKPVKVTVMNVKGQKVSLRTRRGSGMTNSYRKASVYLKEGDVIDFAS